MIINKVLYYFNQGLDFELYNIDKGIIAIGFSGEPTTQMEVKNGTNK